MSSNSVKALLDPAIHVGADLAERLGFELHSRGGDAPSKWAQFAKTMTPATGIIVPIFLELSVDARDGVHANFRSILTPGVVEVSSGRFSLPNPSADLFCQRVVAVATAGAFELKGEFDRGYMLAILIKARQEMRANSFLRAKALIDSAFWELGSAGALES